MFIRLTDARLDVAMLVPLREIIVVKDYIPSDSPVENAKSVVMIRPINEGATLTHNYFVTETIDDIERLMVEALELSY